jgi:hypothetical protein
MTRRFKTLRSCFLLFCIAVILAFVSTASAQWNEQVLYSFQGLPDGATPVGGMVFDKEGNLYGATANGGSSSCSGPGQCGTVFQLAPPAKHGDPWTETVLYVFKGRANNDGATPGGGLIRDASGNLYGTTGYDGTGTCKLLGGVVGCGVVYELSPPAQRGGAWTEKVLYSFQGGNDGYVPTGDLVFDKAGNLYGATLFGGGKGTNCNSLYGGNCGTIFELSPPAQPGGAWTEMVVHSFAGVGPAGTTCDGANPNGELVIDETGVLYGTTYAGGFNCPHNSEQGCGTVFKLASQSVKRAIWTETLLYIFKGVPDGSGPAAGVIFDGKGDLFGTTAGGGDSKFPSGTVFRLAPQGTAAGWTENLVYSFSEGSDGGQPRGVVVLDPKGELYGTAALAGNGGAGTLYQLRSTIATSQTLEVLHTFTAHGDGEYPYGGLVVDAAGPIFGVTQYGGVGATCGQNGCGTVFEVTP